MPLIFRNACRAAVANFLGAMTDLGTYSEVEEASSGLGWDQKWLSKNWNWLSEASEGHSELHRSQ